MARVSKVDLLGQKYHDAKMQWGERNLITERAFMAYQEAKDKEKKRKSKGTWDVRKTKAYKEGMKAEKKRRSKMSVSAKKREDKLADATWRLQHPKRGSWSVKKRKTTVKKNTSCRRK